MALNSSQFQLSRVVGPVFAALGFKFFGLAGCFYANGISFIAVVIALRMVRFDESMKTIAAHSVKDRRALWQDLIAGFRYVRHRPRVLSLLSISAATSLFGAPYLTLAPIFARDIFHLGASGLAWMMGTAGAGAFLGALVLAYLGDFKRKGWSVLGGAFSFGVCLIVFCPVDQPGSFVDFSLRHRVFHCHFGSGHQHTPAETRDGRNARPRDEYVHSFICGSHADWEPACRRGLTSLRSTGDPHSGRTGNRDLRDDRYAQEPATANASLKLKLESQD